MYLTWYSIGASQSLTKLINYRKEERKKGRKEGRKEGREEGRKGGREEPHHVLFFLFFFSFHIVKNRDGMWWYDR